MPSNPPLRRAQREGYTFQCAGCGHAGGLRALRIRVQEGRQEVRRSSATVVIHGSIHGSIQRMRFHRANFHHHHAAHSRQALSDGVLLRLVLLQDARAAQEEAARDFTARAEMPHLIHSIRTSVQTVA